MRPISALFLTVILFVLSANTGRGQIVISEVYAGGGLGGSTYKNDFVELYNNGSTTVNMTGWTLQYATANGAFTTNVDTGTNFFVNLSQTLDPGKTAIIVLAGSGGGTTAVPTTGGNIQRAFSGSIDVLLTNGKIALANNSIAVRSVPEPVTSGVGAYSNVVDFAGFGNPNQFEGNSAAPDLTILNSVARRLGETSLVDTNNNANDFVSGSPTPGSVAIAVPEPGSLLLVGTSCLTALAVNRFRRSSIQAASRTGA